MKLNLIVRVDEIETAVHYLQLLHSDDALKLFNRTPCAFDIHQFSNDVLWFATDF